MRLIRRFGEELYLQGGVIYPRHNFLFAYVCTICPSPPAECVEMAGNSFVTPTINYVASIWWCCCIIPLSGQNLACDSSMLYSSDSRALQYWRL